ncbi:MAG: S41 family peptidase [Patescibacteria group bacterium]
MEKISKKRVVIVTVLTIFGLAALGGAFWFGFDTGTRFPQILIVQGVKNLESDKPVAADFSVFWQAWQKIGENYVNIGKVEDQDKVYGAIKGLVGSLGDPYTVFFDPEDGEKFAQDIKGNFGGIGAEIGIRKDQLTIVSPLKDTPAFKAGLKAGDKILQIDAKSTDGLTVNESVGLIRGEIGTAVTLTTFRDAWDKPKEIKIVRANIVVPTLDYKMLNGGLAHVQLYSFNANSNNLFGDNIRQAMRNGSKGLILDLRNNPGGYLSVAVDLAGWFLSPGTLVVSESDKTGPREQFKAQGNGLLKDFPVVVLINEGSASASEILAGALRDNLKTKLIGKKSFGKGTVQQVEYLKDGSSLKITVANWVLPSGKILEGEGLAPDYEVLIKEEDSENEKDPQLDKAIEVLKSEIANQVK